KCFKASHGYESQAVPCEKKSVALYPPAPSGRHGFRSTWRRIDSVSRGIDSAIYKMMCCIPLRSRKTVVPKCNPMVKARGSLRCLSIYKGTGRLGGAPEISIASTTWPHQCLVKLLTSMRASWWPSFQEWLKMLLKTLEKASIKQPSRVGRCQNVSVMG